MKGMQQLGNRTLLLFFAGVHVQREMVASKKFWNKLTLTGNTFEPQTSRAIKHVLNSEHCLV